MSEQKPADNLARCPRPKLIMTRNGACRNTTAARSMKRKLVLDGFQAGLSWITILRKR
jgi:3-methyladenine DNA glycosylase Tag